MWLSWKWMQNVMLGSSSTRNDQPLLNSLLKLRMGHTVYISEGEPTSPEPPEEEKSTADCPAFIRKAFRHSISLNDATQLKELFVICERNSLEIPGELFPEIWQMYDTDLSFGDLYIRMLHPYFNFLSRYFEDFHHFDLLLSQEEWQALTLGQKKLQVHSQFAWRKTPNAMKWIKPLPSTERVELMEDNIYRDFTGRTELAEEWASSRSKKATAIANVYLMKDKSHANYQSAMNYLKDVLTYRQDIILKEDEELPFQVYEAKITKDTATILFKLIAWMDPSDIFDHLNINSTLLSEKIMELDENEAWVAHILHGAIYHKNEDWIKYALEMIRYYDLVNVKFHKHWPKMVQKIKPAIVINSFLKSLRKAQNDLDRIDAMQHWLFAADLFISRELTEQLWSTIGTGLELIAYGELSLEHYKDLFTYIQNRMHPAIAGEWEQTKGKSEFTSTFQTEVKRRYFLYKSLNQWLKSQQNN